MQENDTIKENGVSLSQRSGMNSVMHSRNKSKIWFLGQRPAGLPKMTGWCSMPYSGWPKVADIPERYGPHQTVYSRFYKWRNDRSLLRIFHALNKDADYENLCMDSTSIKAHPHSADPKRGLLIRNTTSLSGLVGVERLQKFTPLWMPW